MSVKKDKMAGFLNDWTQSFRNNIGGGAKELGSKTHQNLERAHETVEKTREELEQASKNIKGIGSDIREGFRNINKYEYTGSNMADLKKLEELQAKELGRVNYEEDPGYVANGISTTGRPHYTNADDFVPGTKTIEEIKNMQMKGTPEWIYDLKNTNPNPSDIMEYAHSHPYVAGAAGMLGAAGIYGMGRMSRKNKTTNMGGEKMNEREYARVKQAAAMGNIEAQGIVDTVEGVGITPIIKEALTGNQEANLILDGIEAIFGEGAVKAAFDRENEVQTKIAQDMDSLYAVGQNANMDAAAAASEQERQHMANYFRNATGGTPHEAYMPQGEGNYNAAMVDGRIIPKGIISQHALDIQNWVSENPHLAAAIATTTAAGAGYGAYRTYRAMKPKTAPLEKVAFNLPWVKANDGMDDVYYARDYFSDPSHQTYMQPGRGSVIDQEYGDNFVDATGSIIQQHPYASALAAAGALGAAGYGAYRGLKRR